MDRGTWQATVHESDMTERSLPWNSLEWVVGSLKCRVTTEGWWLLSRSVMSDSFTIPWTIAHQPPLSIGFHRQECWNGLPLPFPGDLPDPGIKLVSPALTDTFFTTGPPGYMDTYLSKLCFKSKVFTDFMEDYVMIV